MVLPHVFFFFARIFHIRLIKLNPTKMFPFNTSPPKVKNASNVEQNISTRIGHNSAAVHLCWLHIDVKRMKPYDC